MRSLCLIWEIGTVPLKFTGEIKLILWSIEYLFPEAYAPVLAEVERIVRVGEMTWVRAVHVQMVMDQIPQLEQYRVSDEERPEDDPA